MRDGDPKAQDALEWLEARGFPSTEAAEQLRQYIESLERELRRWEWVRPRLDHRWVREAAFDYPTGCTFNEVDVGDSRKAVRAIDAAIS